MNCHTEHFMLENYNVHYIKESGKNKDDASYIRIKTQIPDSRAHAFATVKNCIRIKVFLELVDILIILPVIMLMPTSGYYHPKYYSDLSLY